MFKLRYSQNGMWDFSCRLLNTNEHFNVTSEGILLPIRALVEWSYWSDVINCLDLTRFVSPVAHWWVILRGFTFMTCMESQLSMEPFRIQRYTMIRSNETVCSDGNNKSLFKHSVVLTQH